MQKISFFIIVQKNRKCPALLTTTGQEGSHFAYGLVNDDAVFVKVPGPVENDKLAPVDGRQHLKQRRRWGGFLKVISVGIRPTTAWKPVSMPSLALETGFRAGIG